MPATSQLELLRRRLDNGLTVLVAPDHASPLVGVAVVYDVGFRSEPEGRTGFAHLFEHLMFQGSEHVGKAEHPRLVQSAGGVMNGHTRNDLTAYYQVVPAPALELTLWLEADRMARLALTQENLDNQVAVVKEEIRVNVLNQPFGGFPWIPLPALAFDTFPNAHNGYGDFTDLEHATLADAADFYRSYYTPANAVLVVTGDCEPEATLDLVERHFAGITGGPRPTRGSFAEPRHTELRRRALPDPLAPTPALAAGYRVPDPVSELEPYLASVVLADLLSDGDASRLRERLVHREAVVTDLGCQVGLLGDPFSARDPVLLQVILFHPGLRSADELLRAVGEEIERLAAEGPTEAELARVAAQDAGRHWREVDQLLSRTLSLGDSEIIHARPELAAALPELVAAVTPDQVRRAARDLLDQQPALLEVVPSPEGPRQ